MGNRTVPAIRVLVLAALVGAGASIEPLGQ